MDSALGYGGKDPEATQLILHAGGSEAFHRRHVSPERGRIGVRARPLARGSYDSLGTARSIRLSLAHPPIRPWLGMRTRPTPAGGTEISRWSSAAIPPVEGLRDDPILEGWQRSPCVDRRKNTSRKPHLWHPSGMRERANILFRWCRYAQPPANFWHPCRDGRRRARLIMKLCQAIRLA